MSEVIEENNKRRASEGSDTEYDPQYKPIISLPEVEVSTNEENEIELLKLRAKLYRFESSDDPPEWKERGTGEMKLLRNKENNAMRLVMRRDKTLKVCANHFITPWMELNPSTGTEKAFIYSVLVDFADEKPKSECLAIRFGTVENATLFKQKFEEAKKILLTECDLYNGKCDEEEEDDSIILTTSDVEENNDKETDKITEKLADLDVKNNKDK